MTDQTDHTDIVDVNPELLVTNIRSAFMGLYPNVAPADIEVRLNIDETIDVEIPEGPTFRADIDSDDDGYLRFGLYDPDYADEYPDEDPLDPVSVRVKAF